jgi:transcriptional regulator with XRE-family HTH domain
VEESANALGIAVRQYEAIERGESALEHWAPRWAELAIKLSTPISRLLAESGRSADHEPGGCGRLIRARREALGKTAEQLAREVGLSDAEYEQVERGTTLLDEWAPRLLRCAELFEQPVFYFLLPFGLPFQSLDVSDLPSPRNEATPPG